MRPDWDTPPQRALPSLGAEDGRWIMVWEPHLTELLRAAENASKRRLSGLAGRYRRNRLARAVEQLRSDAA